MVGEVAVVAETVGVDQLELGDPVEGAPQRGGVRLEGTENRLPTVEAGRADAVGTEGLEPVHFVVLAGEVENRHCASIAVIVPPEASWSGDSPRSCETVCIADTGRASTKPALPRASGSMPAEVDRRRADLEERRDLGEVGVAGDDVEPAVAHRVGVRLVPGVDDRPLQRRLEADLLLEKVRPLAELEGGGAVAGFLTTDLARARVGRSRPRDEVCGEVSRDSPERHGAVDEVVLMAAVGVAFAVGVVLVNDDRLAVRHPAPTRNGRGSGCG